MRNLFDWMIAIWLLACLAWALNTARIGVVERDLMLLALSSLASIGVASVIAPSALRTARRVTTDRRRDERAESAARV
jgi:hypothetical protein